MIRQLLTPFPYTANDLACIIQAASNWDSGRNCIKDLKDRMNTHFDTHQNEKCCYCGLLYNRTGRGEIDHIAPKGVNLYPQFTFAGENLAKACQLCNSSTMKHTFDTVRTLNNVYSSCDFKIVHPYLDNHDQHYRWNYGLLRVVISVNNNSNKAIESIKLFELDSEKRTRARAQQRNQERLEILYDIPANVKAKIRSIMNFRNR